MACGCGILWRSALVLYSLAWLVSHEAARIHEHTRTAHQVYQKADDAISDIQANINKGALIEQSGFSNPDSVETRKRISDLQQVTKNDCATLIDLIGASQGPRFLPWSMASMSTGAPFRRA